MINVINLRTNKSEYKPGDEIFGVVYLRIVSPTSGRGVCLRFHGYEKVVYEYKTDVINGNKQKYSDTREYINYEVPLFETEEPLVMGNTMFPFRIVLPTEIPGTFSAYDETDVIRWEATVQYTLEVFVIDAQRFLNTQQNINIGSKLPKGLTDPPFAVSATYKKRSVLIFTDEIHVTVRLFSYVNRSGERAKLRVIITNESNIKVQSIKIQILQTILLKCRDRSVRLSWEDYNVHRDETSGKVDILVRNNRSVIRQQDINMLPFQKGLDCIQIPLTSIEGPGIPPTVTGQHIKCSYYVRVDVTLSNGGTFDFNVPLNVLWPEKDREWEKWQAPEWILIPGARCNIHHSDSVLRVAENLLSTPAFSNIPGFHAN